MKRWKMENKLKIKRLSFCSIVVALGSLLFFLARLSPLSDIAIYCVISMLIALVCEKFDIPGAIMVYICLIIISFFILAPFMNFAFILFFGPWPIILALLSKLEIKSVFFKYLVKFLCATSLLLIFLLVFFLIFPQEIRAVFLNKFSTLKSKFNLGKFIYLFAFILYFLAVEIYERVFISLLDFYFRKLNHFMG